MIHKKTYFFEIDSSISLTSEGLSKKNKQITVISKIITSIREYGQGKTHKQIAAMSKIITIVGENGQGQTTK